jgi:general secretion pathway protein I
LESDAGFTLIEALVALSVTAFSLFAIGSLMATNIRGAARIEQRLPMISALRSVMTALPGRSNLPVGNLSGETDGRPWSVDVVPYQDGYVNNAAAQFWVPQAISIKVMTPSGAPIEIQTIRLNRRTDR